MTKEYKLQHYIDMTNSVKRYEQTIEHLECRKNIKGLRGYLTVEEWEWVISKYINAMNEKFKIVV